MKYHTPFCAPASGRRIRPLRLALALSTAIGALVPSLPAAHAQDSTSNAAPPERVGQIAQVRGSVSFDTSSSTANGTTQWTPAALNYPVTSGDALYTQPGASAAVAIDWSRISMNEGTELQVTTIGPQVVDAALSQGEAYLDLRNLAPGDSYAITTPRGTVNISQNGQYDIIAGDQTAPTTVTVIRGAAQLQGQNVALDIAPGETATLQGANPVTAALGAGQRDPFVVRMLAVRYAPPPSYVPPVVNQMTGGYQLAQYGAWSQTPQYGAIWYPRVARGWVPYREGHWAYVAPWGWTWVDNDPWGFAPFHYGRWVQYGGRWGWAPAPVAYAAPAYYQPVYAPATVSFFNVGTGVAIGVGLTAAAFAVGSIGWVPLGPNEAYRPWYHCPPHYVRQINYYNIHNANQITDIHNTTIINNYGPARLINRGAATVIPADAMRRGDPVARFGRPAPHAVLAAARPVPPAGFQGPAPRPHPGGPGPQGFGRLPGAPGAMVHRVAAQAPRPAPFAAAQGLPVARPAPIRQAVIRPQIHVLPRNTVPQPGALPGAQARPVLGAQARPVPRARPGVVNPAMHPMPAAIGRPMQPQIAPHIGTPQPPSPPVTANRPHAARPAPARPPQFHPPVQQARPQPPQFHPPVQQARPQPPQFHPPVQQARPQPPQFHPPVQQARPQPLQFHPPVQQARPQPPQFHPPVQQARPQPPQFHPPVQQARPQPQARPMQRQTGDHPVQQHP